jgi:hypothetical protein
MHAFISIFLHEKSIAFLALLFFSFYFFSFFSFFHFVWGIYLGITCRAFTLFIAEGCAFRALDTAACVMLAFITLGLGANVMLTRTLLPSTCLADKDIFLLV